MDPGGVVLGLLGFVKPELYPELEPDVEVCRLAIARGLGRGDWLEFEEEELDTELVIILKVGICKGGALEGGVLEGEEDRGGRVL